MIQGIVLDTIDEEDDLNEIIENIAKKLLTYILLGEFTKRDYEQNPKQESHKWKQKDGSTCDDIIFTNGLREIGFDEWISLEYK